MSERPLQLPRDFAAPLPPLALLRRAMALGTRAYLKAYHRLHIIGRDNIPARGPVILVANHASHVDVACLLAALPLNRLEHAYAAAAEDYFSAGFPRFAMNALMIKNLPFARGTHRRQSLTLCCDLLTNSDNVLIWFAEGTRTRNGEVNAFRHGIGALVAGTNISVVPCAIRGSFKAWPKGRYIPWPTHISLTVGTPRRYNHLRAHRDSYDTICNDLHHGVKGLLCT